jgi:hypothetical protein
MSNHTVSRRSFRRYVQFPVAAILFAAAVLLAADWSDAVTGVIVGGVAALTLVNALEWCSDDVLFAGLAVGSAAFAVWSRVGSIPRSGLIGPLFGLLALVAAYRLYWNRYVHDPEAARDELA